MKGLYIVVSTDQSFMQYAYTIGTLQQCRIWQLANGLRATTVIEPCQEHTMELTELQKMQIAYAHFTLEEWKILAKCVWHTQGDLYGTKQAVDENKVTTMLSKFPSAVL